MKGIYEVVLAGFDGGTDATDDLILWVDGTREELDEIVTGSGAAIGEVVKDADPYDIDYVLPKDAGMLSERIGRVSPGLRS